MTRYLDILGRSFTVPDPGDVADLSVSYRAVCASIEEANGQLGALSSPQARGEWAGPAADAFARSIGRLPGQLDQAGQSYHAAAWALSEYASGLGPVVAALATLAYQAEEAQGHLTAVTTAREQVIQQGQDPGTTGWDARQQDAQAAVDDLRGRLSSLLDEMNSLSAECVTRIRQAQREGIQNNPITDFERYVLPAAAVAWHDAGQAVKVTGDVLDALFVKPLVTDVDNFRRGDWSWENIGKTLGDIGFDLGIALLVVGLFVSGVGEVATPFMLGLGVLTTGAEGMAAAEHEPGASWGQVGASAFWDVALPFAGGALGGGVAKDGQDLADGKDARVSGGTLWNEGVKHVFNLDDALAKVRLVGPVDALRDDLSSVSELRGDGLSPAATTLERLKFVTDVLSHGHDAQHAWQLATKGDDE
jgi:hypothetical protein